MNLGRYIRTIYLPQRNNDRPIPVPNWPRRTVTVPVRREGARPEEAEAPRPEVNRARP
jgi:hypothetical protein